MRQLKISANNAMSIPSNLPKMGMLTHLEELTRFDFIYCFHIIKNGHELSISRDYDRYWDNEAFIIHYKKHKLGYLSSKTASLINRHLNKGNLIRVFVKNAPKSSSTALLNLDIEITIHDAFNTFS